MFSPTGYVAELPNGTVLPVYKIDDLGYPWVIEPDSGKAYRTEVLAMLWGKCTVRPLRNGE